MVVVVMGLCDEDDDQHTHTHSHRHNCCTWGEDRRRKEGKHNNDDWSKRERAKTLGAMISHQQLREVKLLLFICRLIPSLLLRRLPVVISCFENQSVVQCCRQ